MQKTEMRNENFNAVKAVEEATGVRDICSGLF